MRILPMNLYTDKRRNKHGRPTPHTLIVWKRGDDGTCMPHLAVTDIGGDVATHTLEIDAYMVPDANTMADLHEKATYLLDILRGEDEPNRGDPSDRDLDRQRESREDYRAREDRNLRGY